MPSYIIMTVFNVYFIIMVLFILNSNAQSFFSRADERIQEEQQHEEQERAERGAATNSAQPDDYYHGLGITVRYNRARLHEAQGRPDLAEEIYKSILLKHPSYIDCKLG